MTWFSTRVYQPVQRLILTMVAHSENSTALQKNRRQFLPAALEVEETPASPAGRAIIWAIVLLFAIAVIWACVGKVDIVATAQGKIVPGERVKTIQPMVIGEVQTIHVREGDVVNVGDPLITLVDTVTEAEWVRLSKEIAALSLQQAREQTFVHYLDSGNRVVPELAHYLNDAQVSGTPEALLFEEQLLAQQIEDYVSASETLKSQQKSKAAERQTLEAVVTKLQRVLPIIEERTRALAGLYQKNYGSKVQYLELEQQRIELEEDLKAQQAAVQQLSADMEAIRNQQLSLHARTRRESLDQQEQLRRQLDSLKQESIKARVLHDQQQILSPIDGTVQQLQVHTIGGVVQPAQPLMQIVPAEATMEVEAWVLNKDIGFVHEGQVAEVKIDTFNFTKYGIINGELTHISDDAVSDEEQGLRYLANVEIEKAWMAVENRRVNLSPGMGVAVEIKTGQRRLIEYFLSPLLRFKQESIRER
ncbi:HlyD family type I secretion periplasmic adaptor subunit [Endozoicomonas sp. ONNA2]|uniref:HlyD family type I secretion periplasmic adaptor subunit n=1 Tax=Endozoicomonas sp. ONNA2 TaxID=2828741 RepID=UPI002147964F|nr:HlyD family type I secretion periplasmic adaptor subunit [Endozoicomonas sp. ONNA2]